jgi:hypothetical protein
MKWSGTAFVRRPSRFVRRANKTFQLLTITTGLPTDECCLDLREQDSVVCSPFPAALVDRGTTRLLAAIAEAIRNDGRSPELAIKAGRCCVVEASDSTLSAA